MAWIILGAVGVVFWLVALVWFAWLCINARELSEDAHRDEYIATVPLYSTMDRGADPRVVREMHTGTLPDAAVAKVYGTRR